MKSPDLVGFMYYLIEAIRRRERDTDSALICCVRSLCTVSSMVLITFISFFMFFVVIYVLGHIGMFFGINNYIEVKTHRRSSDDDMETLINSGICTMGLCLATLLVFMYVCALTCDIYTILREYWSSSERSFGVFIRSSDKGKYMCLKYSIAACIHSVYAILCLSVIYICGRLYDIYNPPEIQYIMLRGRVIVVLSVCVIIALYVVAQCYKECRVVHTQYKLSLVREM